MKKQLETHYVLVRWGAYCPHEQRELHERVDGQMEVHLYGGGSGLQAHNPEQKLVFKRPDTNMQYGVS